MGMVWDTWKQTSTRDRIWGSVGLIHASVCIVQVHILGILNWCRPSPLGGAMLLVSSLFSVEGTAMGSISTGYYCSHSGPCPGPPEIRTVKIGLEYVLP